MENVAKWTLSTVLTVLVFLFGECDVALLSLIAAICLDYISGVAKAFIKGNLDSKVGFKGIVKKFLILCIVAVSVLADRLAGDTGLIRTMVIYYLVANEGLSIAENLAAVDILVPDFLKKRLEHLKRENEGGNTNEG